MRREEEAPESIVAARFAGLRNNVSRERLALEELEAAINVDIDDRGQVRRRRGFTQMDTGNFHSLTEHKGYTYVVKNSALCRVNDDVSVFSLVQVSHHPMDYTAVGDRLYYSSLTHSGYLENGVPGQWGGIVGSMWVSPVVAPTDTIGEVAGRLLGGIPPKAEHIAAYKGRIYMAIDNVIWATELYQYDYVDKTRNFMTMDHKITMLEGLEDGLLVGTEAGLYYLSGTFGKMKVNEVVPHKVLRGSAVRVPNELVHPNAKNAPMPTGEAVVLMTSEGIHAAFDDGTCYNLTSARVEFPAAQSAAALFRQQDGANTYVAVMDSAGTPANQARIGDYVDAEIRRFGGN